MNTSNPQSVYFEHPVNERYRFFLRMEYIFNLIDHAMEGKTSHDSHIALSTLLDLISVVNRIDLKTEVIKELERIKLALGPLQNTPNVEHQKLSEILESLEKLRAGLFAVKGALDLPLKNIELIKSLQQRHGVSSTVCDFELPLYRYWLSRDEEQRQGDLKNWLQPFNNLQSALHLIMHLVRQSTALGSKVAESGIYKQTLEASTPCQLIVVSLPADTPYAAEFSGGKHRFTLRFLDTSTAGRPSHTQDSVEFQLGCCIL